MEKPIKIDANLIQTLAKEFKSEDASSGVLGKGWIIETDGNNVSYLEVDDLRVRNALKTHIFQKDIVKATSGQLLVSDSAVVHSIEGTTILYTKTAESSDFKAGDQIQIRDRDSKGNIFNATFTIASKLTTSDIPDTTKYTISGYTKSGTGVFEGGMTAVRINGARILIVASDGADTKVPYISFHDNDTEVVRIGNIEGSLGSVGGYGLYATNVELTGKITATGGEIAGWTIGTNKITGGNTELNNTGLIQNTNPNGWKLNADGSLEAQNATIKGDVTAESGKIAGWTIEDDKLTAGGIELDATSGSEKIKITNNVLLNQDGSAKLGKLAIGVDGSINTPDDNFYIDANGNATFSGKLEAASGTFAGNISAATGTFKGAVEVGTGSGKITINNDGLSVASGKFSIDSSTGEASFGGDLTSPSGTIGGWTIGSSSLHNNKDSIDSTKAGIYIGIDGISTGTTGAPKFKVTNDGVLTATDATITGEINATSGTFNGDIVVGTHTSNKITIKGSSTNTDTKIYSGVGTYGNTNTGFYMDASGRFSLGNKLTWDGSALSINGSGTITGTVNANSGVIGNTSGKQWIIGGNTSRGWIYNGKKSLTDSLAGIYLGTDGLALGSGTNPEFKVTPVGKLTATDAEIKGKITATSGTIGAHGTEGNRWQIGSTSIYNKKSSLNSDTKGVYIGTDGINIGDNSNYLKWEDSSLDIKGNLKIISDYYTYGPVKIGANGENETDDLPETFYINDLVYELEENTTFTTDSSISTETWEENRWIVLGEGHYGPVKDVIPGNIPPSAGLYNDGDIIYLEGMSYYLKAKLKTMTSSRIKVTDSDNNDYYIPLTAHNNSDGEVYSGSVDISKTEAFSFRLSIIKGKNTSGTGGMLNKTFTLGRIKHESVSEILNLMSSTSRPKPVDITKEAIETVLTGDVTSHTHSQYVTNTTIANDTTLGLVRTGATTTGKSYPVKLNASNQMYVDVPWQNTIYSHPTGDGNLHVPATGTINKGKFLKAGETAGAISWQNLVSEDIPDWGVTTDKIADDAITGIKISDGTIGLGKIAKIKAQSFVANNTDGADSPWAISIEEARLMLNIDNVDNTKDSTKSVSYAATAGSASKLTTKRKINGVDFDGSANITIKAEPTDHASTSDTYGLGTTAVYGHVKTVNNLTTSSHTNGLALSAYQGRVLNNLITNKTFLKSNTDNRSVNTIPNDYNGKLEVKGLKSNSAIGISNEGTYSGVLGMRGWSDSSGGNAHEFALTGNGNIYHRHGSTTTWGSWGKIITTNNILSTLPTGSTGTVLAGNGTSSMPSFKTLSTINNISLLNGGNIEISEGAHIETLIATLSPSGTINMSELTPYREIRAEMVPTSLSSASTFSGAAQVFKPEELKRLTAGTENSWTTATAAEYNSGSPQKDISGVYSEVADAYAALINQLPPNSESSTSVARAARSSGGYFYFKIAQSPTYGYTGVTFIGASGTTQFLGRLIAINSTQARFEVSAPSGATYRLKIYGISGGIGTPDLSIKTINTDNASTLPVNSSESLAGSGTLNLHKISKTGNYNDLIGKLNTNYSSNGKNYKVQVDSNNNMFVNVPWTDNNTVTRLRGTTSGTLVSGDITLAAGNNVSISQSGNIITINSTASGGSSSLSGLSDVSINSPQQAQVLTYSDGFGGWINAHLSTDDIQTGTLSVARGGTGRSSLNAYRLLAGGTTTTGNIQSVSAGTSGQLLRSNGSSSLPSFTSIKTINGQSLLGSGDITVSASIPVPLVLTQGAGSATIQAENTFNSTQGLAAFQGTSTSGNVYLSTFRNDIRAAVYAEQPTYDIGTKYAGYFDGDVSITGNLTVGTGSTNPKFRIESTSSGKLDIVSLDGTNDFSRVSIPWGKNGTIATMDDIGSGSGGGFNYSTSMHIYQPQEHMDPFIVNLDPNCVFLEFFKSSGTLSGFESSVMVSKSRIFEYDPNNNGITIFENEPTIYTMAYGSNTIVMFGGSANKYFGVIQHIFE